MYPYNVSIQNDEADIICARKHAIPITVLKSIECSINVLYRLDPSHATKIKQTSISTVNQTSVILNVQSGKSYNIYHRAQNTRFTVEICRAQ